MPGLPPFKPLLVLTAAAVLAAVIAHPATAQLNDIDIQLDRPNGAIGLAGRVRPGHWTPIRLTLANHSSELREIRVQWSLRDEDGDRVIAQRTATLNPMRDDSHLWLYAAPDAATGPRNLDWKIRAIDTATGRPVGPLLDIKTHDQDPTVQLLNPADQAIGIMSTIALGLDEPSRGHTSHETTALITGLRLDRLPDRWYGLSAIDTLIWTHGDGEGGDPTDPSWSPDAQEALRQWVRRGGHLILVLPPYAQTWTGSPLSDLLPVTADHMRRVEDFPPLSVGTVFAAERAPIPLTVFDLPPNSPASIIERDRQGNPLVIAHRVGFGRVTLVGIDLADRQLVRMGLPNGRWTLWHKIFNWHHPAFTDAQVKTQVRLGDMLAPQTRHASATRLEAGWLRRITIMTGTATPALLLAIIIYLIYWIIAGPGLYGILRARGLHRHSWVAFVGIVGIFTALTWIGATAFRKAEVTVAHVSVIDIDGTSGQVHSRGWLSLFVPTFGTTPVAIDPDHPDRHNTLATAGFVGDDTTRDFPDQQTYRIDAAAPDLADVPVRATTKRFTYDYLGTLGEIRTGLPEPWPPPRGVIRIENGWPVGQATHNLPGALTDLLIVYCPGDGQIPWVWRHPDPWVPGLQLPIAQPARAMRLVVPRPMYTRDRQFKTEGFLGVLMADHTAGEQQPLLPRGHSGHTRDMKQQFEMLSFFDALPPPNFRRTDTQFGTLDTTGTYHRIFGRNLDLSPLINGRRLIIIGYLNGPHLPVPLTVAGRPVEQISDRSWTVIRWIHDL